MKKIFLLAAFFLAVLICAGQKKLPGLGEITVQDLQLKNCSFEPDAPAMKMFETEETDFEFYSNGGSRLKTEHRARIKIFSEKGYEFATISIPYLTKKSLGKIKELSAWVYTLEPSGKITIQKLEKDDFFKQKIIGNVGLVKFSFPNVKPGSVVEYQYTRIEQNVYDLDPWRIQDEIPIAYSSFILTTPQTSLVRSKLYGQDSVRNLTLRKKNPSLQYESWYREEIPSFPTEPYMTSRVDNRMRMIFFHFPVKTSLISTITNPVLVWSLVGEFLLESPEFGGQIKKQIPGTDKIVDSAKRLNTVTEKVKLIYNAVKRRFPGSKDQSREVEDITAAWKEQTGTSGEINLILLNLLGKLKIPSYPLLVSTRENGMVDKSFPSFGQLNSIVAIAMLDSSRYFLLDASLPGQAADCPPASILNREALLVKKGNIDWFTVVDERPLFKKISNIICDINKDGLIEGGATLQYYNYAKQFALDTITGKENRSEEKYFSKKTPGLTILSSEKTLTESEDDPLYEMINFTFEPQQTNEFYFYNPSFMFPVSANPFISEKRKTDIDLVCNQEIITSLQISIPATFDKEHLPVSTTLMTPDSSLVFKRIVYASPGQLSIITNLLIKRSIYSKDEYESVKDFFRKMQALAAEEIVMIKKK